MKRSSIFSLCNQKGGVGKTTSAINLACGISQRGHTVLLVDMDPQGNATSGLGVEKRGKASIYQVLSHQLPPEAVILKSRVENLSLIPSHSELSGAEVELISLPEREFQLKKALDSIKEDFDYLFIDCPPSLGLLTVNALTASDFVFIPIQCEYYALEGLGDLLRTYSLVKERLNSGLEIGAVLLTMADFRTNLTPQVIEEVRGYFKEKMLETIIPRSVKLSEAPSFGKPGIIYDASSRGSKSYISAVEEFLKRFPPEQEAKEPLGELGEEALQGRN